MTDRPQTRKETRRASRSSLNPLLYLLITILCAAILFPMLIAHRRRRSRRQILTTDITSHRSGRRAPMRADHRRRRPGTCPRDQKRRCLTLVPSHVRRRGMAEVSLRPGNAGCAGGKAGLPCRRSGVGTLRFVSRAAVGKVRSWSRMQSWTARAGTLQDEV